MKTEDQIQETMTDRIVTVGPTNMNFVFRGRIFGVVLAVGDPPVDRHGRVPDTWYPELQFGDYVELTRWDNGTWWKRPIWALFGDPSMDARRVFAPDDGGPEQYTVTNQHYLAIVRPTEIICRWARRDRVFGTGGEDPSPRPIGDRVIVRNCQPPEKSAGGILLPHWFRMDEPIGQVVAVGRDVFDLAPGDWVLIRNNRGTRFTWPDGSICTCLRHNRHERSQNDILGRWDEEPSEEEKRRYSVELNGAVK